MFLAAFLTMHQLALPLPPAFGQDARERLERCVTLAARDPAAAEAEAGKWHGAGGGHHARQCLGVALANQGRWEDSALAFLGAAQEAEMAADARASDYWAQAGNALLAAGEPARARDALDLAIGAGTLAGPALGEAHLDRARARVALGDQTGARIDLDIATREAPDDALGWLLSATLARRMDERARAASDIRQAQAAAPDDAAILLEAGNIAAVAGDEAGARRAWARVTEVAPGSREADAAKAALAQFGQ